MEKSGRRLLLCPSNKSPKPGVEEKNGQRQGSGVEGRVVIRIRSTNEEWLKRCVMGYLVKEVFVLNIQ